MLSAVIGLALAIGMQPPADPGSTPEPHPDLPVSISHIRAALDRPPSLRLTIPESKPTFRVEIRERPLYSPNLLGPVERLWSTTTGPVPPGGLYAFEQRQRLGNQWTQPLFSVDLLSIGAALHNAIANAHRSSAERAARDEVRRAFAEFCAAHDCPP